MVPALRFAGALERRLSRRGDAAAAVRQIYDIIRPPRAPGRYGRSPPRATLLNLLETDGGKAGAAASGLHRSGRQPPPLGFLTDKRYPAADRILQRADAHHQP